MNIGVISFIIIVALLILILINMIKMISGDATLEGMINISSVDNPKWHRNKCNYYVSQTVQDVLDEKKINSDDNNWTIYLPCGYDEIDDEIKQMPIKPNARYFIVSDADNIVAKESLWKYVKDHHGYQRALDLMPNTYILSNNDDVERLKREHTASKIYIMKKNIQRQEGLHITDNIADIMNNKNKGFVIAQELLQNPYTIAGRKINMRFYVLVICHKGNMDVYVFNDGFMYYTKELFRKGSTDFGPNITTGYIDRAVYEVNPLTQQDFRQYLDKDRPLTNIEQHIKNQGLKISNVVFNRIYLLLKNVFMAYVGNICSGKLKNNVTFQLFGVDIAVNDDLYPMIMEVNKGPDLGAKDKRDSELKHSVVRDMLKLIGVVNKDNTKNGFIKILDYEK